MEKFKISVSLFLSITAKVANGTISIDDLAMYIQSGQLPRLPYLNLLSETEKARSAKANGNKTEYDRIKKSLPAVTVHAVFPGERQTGKEDELTGAMMFDFDDVPDADDLVEQSKTIEGVLLAARSLSGKGVHIIIRYTPIQKEYFQYFYTSTQQYLESRLGIKADSACKDLPRLMIINHDPNVYFNPDVQPMDFSSAVWLYKNPISLDEFSDEDEFVRLSNYLDVASPNLNWIPGNRNNTLFYLACCLNRAGFSVEDVVKICCERYVQSDFTVGEIESVIRRAFEKNLEEHGVNRKSFTSKSSKVQKSIMNEIDGDDDNFLLLPLPIKEILHRLPDFYQRVIDPDGSPQEQSLQFMAITIALGAIMHNVFFLDNKGKEVYAPDYFMVIGPSASGKSAITVGEEIFKYYVEYVDKKENPVIIERQVQHDEWEECKKREKKEEDCNCGEEPFIPEKKQLFIEGATTNAFLKKGLRANGDKAALLYEEELDCISDNNRQDYGHNSADFRKIAEQRTIGSGTYAHGDIRVENPKMAILVAGTYAQPSRFFGNKEDGLTSRFMYYLIPEEVQWINHDTYDDVRIREMYDKKRALSGRVHSLASYFDGSYQIYKITDVQNEKLDTFLEGELRKIAINADDAQRAYVFRVYNHLVNMAMILSAQKNCEENREGTLLLVEQKGEPLQIQSFELDDDMVDVVLTLAPSLLQHAYAALEKIPEIQEKEKNNGSNGEQAKTLYEKLPSLFAWHQAIEIASELKISVSTVKRYRNNWITSGLLIREKHGTFSKPRNETPTSQEK